MRYDQLAMGNAKCNLIKQQESIPVGCILPAFVVPGRYPGGRVSIDRPTWIPYPQKGHGTSTIPTLHEQTKMYKSITFPQLRCRAKKMRYICRACVRFIQRERILDEKTQTRMHSSRMRTARLLTVSHCIRWRGGLPNLPPISCPDADSLPDADPLVDRMTDACENITFASFVCER